MSTPTLAERIASALLTPHGGPEGTRLAIKIKRPDGTESDLGGNCKRSIVKAIQRVLDTPPQPIAFAADFAAAEGKAKQWAIEATFARALLSYYRARTRDLGEDFTLDDETQNNIESALYNAANGDFDVALTRLDS